MRVEWSDVEACEEGLYLECFLDLDSGRLVTERGDRPLPCPFEGRPYPRAFDVVRDLREARVFAQRVPDKAASLHLLRVLDDFDSAEHRQAVREDLATIRVPKRLAKTEQLLERFYRQSEEREATLGAEAHWADDTAQMGHLRRRIFDREREKLVGDLEAQFFWPYTERRRSDLWAWFERVPVTIENDPPWLPEISSLRVAAAHHLRTYVSELLSRLDRALATQRPATRLAPASPVMRHSA
jgi:hypothetical protein